MIKYGLISETDARTLEKTIDLICENLDDKHIRITEIGIFNGDTGKGLKECVVSKNRRVIVTGVDNGIIKAIPNNVDYDCIIEGNSQDVYNSIQDESQHLIFIDGLHTFAGVISDFFCYAPKVKVGGFLAFHDTGKHIDPLSGWQGVGDKNDPDMCLGGVRKALNKIGLFEENLFISVLSAEKFKKPELKLIFD